MAQCLPDRDGELVVTAAWLHDIGYAPQLAVTRFHPLDGARALREIGVGERLWGLVAHHSAAIYEAEPSVLTDQLAEVSDEFTTVRHLLWYLDMTTSADGDPVSFDDRMADIASRYPPEHYVMQALGPSMPARRAAVRWARQWLAGAGDRFDHR